MSLSLRSVSHSYNGRSPVLADVSLELEGGMFVAITGPSGSGKSTLLAIGAGLLKPTSGRVVLTAPSVQGIRSAPDVAWIHQTTNVLLSRSVADNVVLPLRIRRHKPTSSAYSRVDAALDAVGLLERKNSNCRELSGGEIQRVCVARAISSQAHLIVADEPTGHLDRVSTSRVVDCLGGAAMLGALVLVATHDSDVARACHLRFVVGDGRVVLET